MPEEETLERAREDRRKGKSASTQAGEFVREEIHHVRQGKHGARSTKQAIAIGLSKARRAGVKLRAPAKGKSSARTRRSAEQALASGQAKQAAKGRTASERSASARKASATKGTTGRRTAAQKAAATRRRKSS
jgi:hypothetical protein